MTHGNGLGKIFIQCQTAGNGAGNAGHFQSVGHAGAIVIALGAQKDLGLVFQPTKGLGVNDLIRIPLIAGTDIVFMYVFAIRTALGLVGKGCLGMKGTMLQSFQFFTHGHNNTPLF